MKVIGESEILKRKESEPKKLRIPPVGRLSRPLPLFFADWLALFATRGRGLRIRGAKSGLMSFMGKPVTGSASPRAISFASIGSMSLNFIR